MTEFMKSGAGRQLVQIALFGIVIWVACLMLRQDLLSLVQVVSSGHADLVAISFIVAGGASFAYSALRILDMRNEMVDRRKAFDGADHVATHDHLTKLPNRYAFDRLVLSGIRPRPSEDQDETEDRITTVFSIDLDGFKKVNDLLGHQGGDILLKEVSKRICALAEHERVFRFGGDEFVVIADNLSPEKEELLAQLLIRSVCHPVLIGSVTTQVGASIGYARMPEHGNSLDEARHRSDIALYQAKSRGRNQYCLFGQEMQEKVAKRAKLEGELRQAIEVHAVKPFYQPLINLKSGDLYGFESLARWQNTNGDFISPQDFIPISEETGLIHPLFEQLLSQACSDARLWPEPLVLAFNVSPIQMQDKMLVERVLAILETTGLEPARLEIEITENALMDAPDLAASMIDQFHALGIQVALDDFGTGYSSLSQLAHFRFDKIKIDKSFVSSAVGNSKSAKIVEAILGLSRSLNLKTTVEGIEENTQLAHFLGLGCDIGQGYLFGRPMPQSKVAPFIAERKLALSA